MLVSHSFFLKEARKVGGELIVALANDKNNKKPYAVSARERKKTDRILNIADKVFIGDAEDEIKIVREMGSDIIVLGYGRKISDGLKKFSAKRIKKFGSYFIKSKRSSS